jgi:hypothetical protein
VHLPFQLACGYCVNRIYSFLIHNPKFNCLNSDCSFYLEVPDVFGKI